MILSWLSIPTFERYARNLNVETFGWLFLYVCKCVGRFFYWLMDFCPLTYQFLSILLILLSILINFCQFFCPFLLIPSIILVSIRTFFGNDGINKKHQSQLIIIDCWFQIFRTVNYFFSVNAEVQIKVLILVLTDMSRQIKSPRLTNDAQVHTRVTQIFASKVPVALLTSSKFSFSRRLLKRNENTFCFCFFECWLLLWVELCRRKLFRPTMGRCKFADVKYWSTDQIDNRRNNYSERLISGKTNVRFKFSINKLSSIGKLSVRRLSFQQFSVEWFYVDEPTEGWTNG